MATRPSNMVPVAKDRPILTGEFTFTVAPGAAVPLYLDPLHDWEIVEVRLWATAPLVAGAPVRITVGETNNPVKFVNADTPGTAQAAETVSAPLPLQSDRVLVRGRALYANYGAAVAAQTGRARVSIRLRPREAQYESSKRPHGAAQAVS
jgi:hypothetical protein